MADDMAVKQASSVHVQEALIGQLEEILEKEAGTLARLLGGTAETKPLREKLARDIKDPRNIAAFASLMKEGRYRSLLEQINKMP